MSREPVVNAAVVGSVVVAGIALLTAFGLNLSEEQQTAVISFVGVVTPLVLAYFQRKKVSPVGESHDHSLRVNR